MVSIPEFLLRRLYVQGSLKNAAGGFEFELRNSLGSGYSQKVWPLKVGGEELQATGSYFIVDGKETRFSDVSPDNTFSPGSQQDDHHLDRRRSTGSGSAYH